ncbi:MAG: hypothetical protein IKS04_06505 [Clostridia bacterium]|nr:hypothetical protein [Clostridia bacterium]
MLGYVKPDRPELKIKEYELYRGIYCSLCRALGRNYSPLAKILLSYDFALAAMIRLALGDESCVFDAGRCPFNPAKRCSYCRSTAETDFCAHCIIIISYYKILDNIRDRGFLKKLGALLIFPVIALMHKKAARLAPDIEKTASGCIKNQAESESRADCSPDEAAHNSAFAMGKTLSYGFEGETAEKLDSLGYMLGRFVYLIDAADDLEDDIKKKNFNPFKTEFPSLAGDGEKKAFAGRVEKALNLTQGRLLEIADTLEFRKFGIIIDNILSGGLDRSARAVISKYASPGSSKEKTFTVK